MKYLYKIDYVDGTLNSTNLIPATEGVITPWVSGRFQSYICKAIEPVIPVVNPALT